MRDVSENFPVQMQRKKRVHLTSFWRFSTVPGCGSPRSARHWLKRSTKPQTGDTGLKYEGATVGFGWGGWSRTMGFSGIEAAAMTVNKRRREPTQLRWQV